MGSCAYGALKRSSSIWPWRGVAWRPHTCVKAGWAPPSWGCRPPRRVAAPTNVMLISSSILAPGFPWLASLFPSLTHSHALTRTHTHITHITHPPPLSRRLTPDGARTHRLIVSSSTLFSVVIPAARSVFGGAIFFFSLAFPCLQPQPGADTRKHTHSHSHNRDEAQRKQRKTAVVKYTIPV